VTHIRKKLKPLNITELPTLRWRWHYPNESRRVWNPIWYNDQFEVVEDKEWNNLVAVCDKFSIRLTEDKDG
jgi:hypothetical protein